MKGIKFGLATMCIMVACISIASCTDACTGVTCQNEGICQVLNGYPQCYCPFGYEGEHCENAFTDTTPPIISGCPQEVTEFGYEGDNITVHWNSPFIWDDSGRLTTTVTSEGADWVDLYSGFFPPDIRTTVTFTAVDEAGNENICKFYVTTATSCSEEPCLNGGTCVLECYDPGCYWDNTTLGIPRCHCKTGFHGTICENEEELPSEKINPIVFGCPDIIRLPIDNPDSQSMRIWWTPPTAYDDSGRFSFSSNYQPGHNFSRNFNFRVWYSVEDAALNSRSCCQFDIYIADAECSTDLGCQNGGTCLRDNGRDLCFCTPDYYGPKCESDRSDFFLRPSECTASCSFGYGGERCENEDSSGLRISAQLSVIIACITTPMMVIFI